jgi:ElaB/YqjD/DUF883 family membrane-anchored ribosome-binding protein
MTRTILLVALPFALAACNVEKDNSNGTTSISVNEAKIDKTLDKAGNALSDVADDVKNAADEAGPKLKNAADDAGAAVKDAGDKIGNGADKAADDVKDETHDNPPKKK